MKKSIILTLLNNNIHFLKQLFMQKKMVFCFCMAFCAKILLLGLFSSEYLDSLFMPFVHYFVQTLSNPWEYYFQNNLNLDSFPYHGLMLYLLTPCMFFIHFFEIENQFIVNLVFKLPLFISDMLLLITLLGLFPEKAKHVFLFYFLNPIIIYAIYIHAQLDSIPMAFFMLGIYYISKDKLYYSAMFIGLALATKMHILIALPLLLFYILKKYYSKDAIAYFLIVFSVFLLFDIPFINSDGFLHMVLMNSKQSLLFDSYYKIGKLELLLPIAAIMMVYLHFFNQQKVNLDLLYFYFGILFTVTILLIYPAPAWYVWLVPFISIYFIQNNNQHKSRLLYLVFSLAYLVFFIFFYKSEYKDILLLNKIIHVKIENEKLTNISFTFLESIVMATMYAFYKYGIKSNAIYQKQTNLTIGIGGDSGVGKSSLLSNLTLILGSKLLQIEGDGEHKWERGNENWSKFTHLDPKANHIHKQADAIHELKHNHVIFRSEYDHSTGTFTKPAKVEPREFIAISGLHPFYLPKLRKIIDLKIYLDTDETLRQHWKIIRDTKMRGYSKAKILEQIEERDEDTHRYIYPQKAFADLIIKFFALDKIELGNEAQKINMGLKITLDANIHVEELLKYLQSPYVWDYNEDLRTQFIELLEEPTSDYAKIALTLVPNIDEIVAVEPQWQMGYQGFIQLIVLVMISEKLKEEAQ